MPQLCISLQEGFRDDLVIIRANGTEVYRRRGLTTDAVVSHADTFETGWEEWPVRIDIEVATRGVSGSTELTVPGYLGVSLRPQGELFYRVSQQPFLYF